MKRTYAHRHHLFPVSACMLGALIASLDANTAELTVARYSTVQPAPSLAQRDPLAAPVVSVLPASVIRIGDAVETLLESSGYRLSPPLAADADRAELLDLPLPEAHRALGPLPLRTALRILAGPAFTLVEDPVHRLISFERCDQGTGKR
ncbi:MAG: pili assembly chaperone [Gammaproteobacteria bacterium]|nr:pili assembly chaperone [Gammaproteobacteria bacterium]